MLVYTAVKMNRGVYVWSVGSKGNLYKYTFNKLLRKNVKKESKHCLKIVQTAGMLHI